MRFYFLMLLALAAFSSGCARNKSSDNDVTPDVHQDKNNTSYEINGKPADEYYKQFQYKKEQGSLPYRYLLSQGVQIKEQDGQQIDAYVSLFLLDTGKFVLKYVESDQEPTSLQGDWSVQETTLMIGDIARGSGLKFNDADTVALKLSKDIVTAGVTAKTFILYYARSSSGL